MAGSSSRIIEPWTGTGWPLEMFIDKSGLSERKSHFCSRSDCGKNRERILREPWQLTCGHRICKDCKDIIANLPEPQRLCDACRDEKFDDLPSAERRRLKKTNRAIRKGEPMETAAESFNVEQGMEVDQLQVVSDAQVAEPATFKISIQDAMVDKAAQRELNRLAVRCPYNCDTAKIVIRTLEKHMAACEHRLVPCEKCTETIKFSQREDHMKNVCQFRPVECPNKCGKKGLQGKDLLKHQAECDKKPPTCQLCKEAYKESSLHEHLFNCKAGCPLGCQAISESSVVDHLNNMDYFAAHALCLLDLAQQVKDVLKNQSQGAGIPQSQISGILDRLLQLELRADTTQRQLAERVSQMTNEEAKGLLDNAQLAEKNRKDLIDLDSLFKVLAGDVHLMSSYETTFRNLAEKVAKTEGENSERLSKLETTANIRVAEIEDQRTALQQYQMTSFNGRLIWRIDRVQARRDEAHIKHSMFSHPFFTEVYGYKMCARIYFNGDGNGKNTHISLFFVVMKGEFDALLPWPFQQKVTMKLRNQTRKRPDIVEKFRPEPSSSSFQRPKNEMNIASGCPQFAEQGLIFNPEHGYVVENTMFLEIVVDPSYEALHGLNVSVQESGRGSAAGRHNDK